jgi:hypothetical protein
VQYLLELFIGFYNEQSAKEVGMTAKIFSGRMHGQVSSPFEGILKRRGSKSRINNQDPTNSMDLNKRRSATLTLDLLLIHHLVGVIFNVSGLSGRIQRGL